MTQRGDFDFDAFYGALSATVAVRDTSWKKVSEETGVSQSTLSRMSKGRRPDAASLDRVGRMVRHQPRGFHERTETRPRTRRHRSQAPSVRIPTWMSRALMLWKLIITTAYETLRRQSSDP